MRRQPIQQEFFNGIGGKLTFGVNSKACRRFAEAVICTKPNEYEAPYRHSARLKTPKPKRRPNQFEYTEADFCHDVIYHHKQDGERTKASSSIWSRI